MNRRSTLKDQVLVLNRNWQPVGYSSVKKIVKKMFTGVCRYIDCYRADEYTEPTFEVHDLRGWLTVKPQPGQRTIEAAKKRYFVTPTVVLFESYDDMPRMEVRFSRTNLLYRDGGRCQYCGVQVVRTNADGKLRKLNEFTIDHVLPKSRGGKNGWMNSVTACHRCNNKKGDRTPEEAGLTLIQQPYKPISNLSFAMSMHDRPEEWDHFLRKVSNQQTKGKDKGRTGAK